MEGMAMLKLIEIKEGIKLKLFIFCVERGWIK